MSDMLFNNGLQYNGMSSSSLQWSSGLDMKPMVCITSAQGGGEYGVKIKHPVKDGRINQWSIFYVVELQGVASETDTAISWWFI